MGKKTGDAADCTSTGPMKMLVKVRASAGFVKYFAMQSRKPFCDPCSTPEGTVAAKMPADGLERGTL
jgi:hypothetical protein